MLARVDRVWQFCAAQFLWPGMFRYWSIRLLWYDLSHKGSTGCIEALERRVITKAEMQVVHGIAVCVRRAIGVNDYSRILHVQNLDQS